MDPTIKAVVIGGAIAALSGVATQLVVDWLRRRASRFDEIRRVASAFVDAVHRLKLPLDRVVSYFTGVVFANAGVDIDKLREQKLVEASEEVTAVRVTALRVAEWQIRVACGEDAVGTAEKIGQRLAEYFQEFKMVQLFSDQQGSVKDLHEHGDRCRELSKEIETLLRQFAEQVRATVG